jgi:hypothetical protein
MLGSVGGMDDKDPLGKLQNQFCIIDLAGEIRILNRKQIKRVKKGSNNSVINYYKKQDGELLMRRYLESLPISSKPRNVIADFWVDPSTKEPRSRRNLHQLQRLTIGAGTPSNQPKVIGS